MYSVVCTEGRSEQIVIADRASLPISGKTSNETGTWAPSTGEQDIGGELDHWSFPLVSNNLPLSGLNGVRVGIDVDAICLHRLGLPPPDACQHKLSHEFWTKEDRTFSDRLRSLHFICKCQVSCAASIKNIQTQPIRCKPARILTGVPDSGQMLGIWKLRAMRPLYISSASASISC